MGGGGINQSATRLEALNIQSSTAGAVIPWLRGMHRIPGNLLWYGDFKATARTQKLGGKGGGGTSTTYTYSASLLMAICHGTISSIPKVWKGKGTSTPASLGLTTLTGAIGQAMWSGLSGRGVQSLNYSGLAAVAALNYSLGDSASVENHSFEVRHVSAYAVDASTPDVDPSVASYELLTHPHQGAAFPAALIGDWSAWSNYCVANKLLVSPLLTTQSSARDALQQMADLTNTGIVWSDGKLKMRPRGDAAATAFGRTYTPDTTPVYQLDDSCFLKAGDEAPVRRSLKSPAERHNLVKVQYRDRSNGYNVAVVEAKDVTDIAANGVRPLQQIDADWICQGDVARFVAEIRKQRELFVQGEYTFRLPWHYALIECMDLVTITDATLLLDNVPVRVKQIVEESDDELAITCEDYPAGVASAPLYPSQGMTGFALNANVSPGSTLTPLVFELPGALTTTGLELAIAAGSTDPNWGGCQVWVSYDGTTYRQIAELRASSRYGTVQTDSGSSLSLVVNAGQQLLSGSATDAASLATLMYLAPAGIVPGEFIAYQTASLTGPGAYTLTGLVRRAYGTPQGTHSTGTPWARVDDAIARSGALDPALIGTTVYVKLTSFNVFGGGQQSLADVAATSYVISGRHYVPDAAGGAGATMNADPGLLDPAKSWTWDGGITVQGPSTATGALGVRYFSANEYGSGNLFAFTRQTFPISSVRTYNLSALLGANPANNRNMYLIVDMYKADGTRLTGADTGWGGAYAGYTFGGVPTSDNAWRRYGQDFGAGTSLPIPASAAYFRVGIWFQYNGGGSSSAEQAAEDIRLVDVTEARTASAAAAAAQGTANTAASNASSALTTLATMRSNGYIDASEKPDLLRRWQAISDERAGIYAQGSAYGLTSLRDAYQGSFTGLRDYLLSLSPAWNDTTTDTPITPATDQATWAAYYSARQALLDAVAQAANQRINKAQGTNLFAGALSSPFGSSGGGNISAVGQPDPLGTANAVNVSLPASGAFVYYRLTGLQAGCYTIKLRLLVGGGASIVVASTDGTSWSGSNYTRATQAGEPIWVQVTLRQYTSSGTVDVAVGSQYDAATGLTAIQTSSPVPVTVSISDLWVEREGYIGDLAATQNQTFYQDSDPGAVPEGSIWVSSTRSYQRQGGTWRPYVGAGSVDTNELAPGAATTLAEVLLASTDVTGLSLATNRNSYSASFNLLGSITFTPKTTGVANLYISGNLLVDETNTRSSASLATAFVKVNVDQNDNGVAEAGDDLAYVQIQQYVTSGRKLTWSGPIAGRVQVAVAAGVSRTLRVYGQQDGDAPRTSTITNLRLGVEGINR